MAKIPVGNFGFQVAQPDTRDRVRMPAGAFGVSDGVAGLEQGLTVAARTISAEEERQRRQQEAEAKAAAKEADRVRSVTAQATAKNALADLHDSLVSGLNDGTFDRAKIGEIQQEKSRKIIEDSLAGVTAEHQDLVRASLLDDIGRSQRDLRKVVDAKNRQDIGAGISNYIESMQRYASRGEEQRQEAMRNVSLFVETAGPQAGMTAETVAKTVQQFKEGVTFNWLDRSISQSQGSGKALTRIAADIAADKFPELDPAKRNFLEAKIQRNQQHLMQQAEVAERRRLSQLDRMASRLSWYVENGRDIPADEFAAFDKASKGTPLEGFTRQITAEQQAVAEFSRLSPVQMKARVRELAASYGPTPNKDQIQHLAKVEKFVDNSIKLLQAAPLEYAVQREGAKVEPLNFADVGSWASNLQNRVAILTEQSKRNGTAPKGLLQQEVVMLSRFLADASDQSKTEALKALRKGFADDKVFRATMQQIAPDSPVTALAGMIATRERPMKVSGWLSDETFSPGSTAALLLSGERLLNPGKDAKGEDGKPKLPMPKDADVRAKFASMTGDAFAGSPEAMQITYQATRAAYAALTAQHGDYSGQLNDKLLKEAIQRATGGVADVNGGMVITPWGMNQSDFRAAARQQFNAAVKAAGIPQAADQWPRMRLQNTKGGYLVKSGTGYLLGKDGNPVLLRITDPNDPSGLVEQIPK